MKIKKKNLDLKFQARWTPEKKKLSVTELEFKLLLGKWEWLLKGNTAQTQSTLVLYPDCFSGSSEDTHTLFSKEHSRLSVVHCPEGPTK